MSKTIKSEYNFKLGSNDTLNAAGLKLQGSGFGPKALTRAIDPNISELTETSLRKAEVVGPQCLI